MSRALRWLGTASAPALEPRSVCAFNGASIDMPNDRYASPKTLEKPCAQLSLEKERRFAAAKALFDECMDVECVDAMAWKSQWRTWREDRMSRTQALVAEYTNLPGSSLSGRRVA